jgi:hypothetical protein
MRTDWRAGWVVIHANLATLVSVMGLRKYRKVTNLENMTQKTRQIFDVLTQILWRTTLCPVAHCLVGGIASLSPKTQGDDDECPSVNVAVRLCGRLGLQYNLVVPIHCALHVCSRMKAIGIIFVFEGWARGFFEAGEFVPLHPKPCLFSLMFVELIRNVMAHRCARIWQLRGNRRMEWVTQPSRDQVNTKPSTSRLTWHPRRFEWTGPLN